MIIKKTKLKGFTLLETLLVMAIISSIILMIITYTTTKTNETKRDFTVLQYEQILNAGLAYYINNSKWPDNIGQLKTEKYLPNKNINNAWGNSYTFYQDVTTGTFSICSEIEGRAVGSSSTTVADTNVISGRLPMGYVAPACSAPPTPPSAALCKSTTCAVVATVNIPGQNLNNARAINFAGLYHNSACVPAPVCPNAYDASTNPTGMKPAIMVMPVSVSGNYEGGSVVYPLSSFTAYAVGNTDKSGDPVNAPGRCTDDTTPETCMSTLTTALPVGNYWRVCLDVVTDRGRIGDASSSWTPDSGTIMAITKCVPNKEPAGSAFEVFQPF